MQIDTANHGAPMSEQSLRKKQTKRQIVAKKERGGEGEDADNCFWHERFRDRRFFFFVSCHLILGFVAFLAGGPSTP